VDGSLSLPFSVFFASLSRSAADVATGFGTMDPRCSSAFLSGDGTALHVYVDANIKKQIDQSG
jgi:hypothetical protein